MLEFGNAQVTYISSGIKSNCPGSNYFNPGKREWKLSATDFLTVAQYYLYCSIHQTVCFGPWTRCRTIWNPSLQVENALWIYSWDRWIYEFFDTTKFIFSRPLHSWLVTRSIPGQSWEWGKNEKKLVQWSDWTEIIREWERHIKSMNWVLLSQLKFGELQHINGVDVLGATDERAPCQNLIHSLCGVERIPKNVCVAVRAKLFQCWKAWDLAVVFAPSTAPLIHHRETCKRDIERLSVVNLLCFIKFTPNQCPGSFWA